MRWNGRILSALAAALVTLVMPWAHAQNSPPGPGQAARGAQAGPGQAGNQAKPAPPDPRKLDELLRQWEENSASLSTLDVEMTRNDKSPAWDEDEHYKGRAMFKSPNRARLKFEKEKEVVNPKTGAKEKKFVDHELIICTGTEVWQYRPENLQIFVYPLEKDMQQRALEEGPLPFLFNFKAAEAKRRYEMALAAENENYYLIRIIPRLEIDKEAFMKALVWLDRKQYLLPKRISLYAIDGKSTKDFTIEKQTPNKELPDANFVGGALRGWKLVRNPGGEVAPAPKATRANPPAPAGDAAPGQQKPAMRSGILGGRRN
jgi:TIGR03009 family protein